MARGRGMIVGRDAELAAVDAVCRDHEDGARRGAPVPGRLVLVRGPAGIGRSALLDTVAANWPAGDAQVLTLRMAEAGRFGVPALLTEVRDHYERVGELRLAESINLVAQLSGAPEDAGAARLPYLVTELTILFTRLRAGRRTLLLVDDVHLVAGPELLLHAARQAGCLVVATVSSTAAESAALDRLLARTDRVIDLAPLAGPDIETVLGQTVGEPVDEAVLPALCAALGPLCGNPAALLSTVDDLRMNGRLCFVRDRICLREPEAPIVLPVTHDLVRRYAESGEPARSVLGVIANAPAVRFTVDDLPAFAAATGGSLTEYGRAVDRLIGARLLSERADGALAFPAPAVAAAVANLFGAKELRATADRLARYLLDRPEADPTLVADLLAAAGPGAPSAAAAELLRGQATTCPTPDRAARWYAAARWHTDDPALVRVLLRELPACGRYAELGDLVAELARHGEFDPAGWRELAAAAAQAALHTGIPVGPDLIAQFDRHGVAGHPDLDRAALWFAGQLAELPDGEPVAGMLAITRRVLDGYAQGHWDDALSQARALELCGSVPTPAHQLGRVHAAEICAERGEAKRAAAWLAGVTGDRQFAAARGWVASGLAFQSGRAQDALRTGWQAYQDTAGSLAVDRLLIRLLGISVHAERTRWTRRVLTELEERLDRVGGPELERITAQARGLALGDREAALTGVKLARTHGHQPDLLRGLLIAAKHPDAPAALLDEAHRLADRIGAPWQRARTRDLMRQGGLTPPRNRSARESFSRTELRVIELIRDGRTNRQIAAELRVSEKTVENQLTRLFARTGCKSRLELAAASLDGRFEVAG